MNPPGLSLLPTILSSECFPGVSKVFLSCTVSDSTMELWLLCYYVIVILVMNSHDKKRKLRNCGSQTTLFTNDLRIGLLQKWASVGGKGSSRHGSNATHLPAFPDAPTQSRGLGDRGIIARALRHCSVLWLVFLCACVRPHGSLHLAQITLPLGDGKLRRVIKTGWCLMKNFYVTSFGNISKLHWQLTGWL